MSTDTFDPTKPLVMAKFGTLNSHDLHGGAPVTIVEEESDEPGEITEEVAERLWNAGRLTYRENARPTPVETVAEAAERLTEVEPLKGSWFMIRAPWIRPIKVQGREAADAARAEVVRHGIDGGVEPLPPEDEPTVEAPAQITDEVPGDTLGNGGNAGLTES
jgi:hypothetical protein